MVLNSIKLHSGEYKVKLLDERRLKKQASKNHSNCSACDHIKKGRVRPVKCLKRTIGIN